MYTELGPFVVGRPKVGLALGSGAARGWAHIGVIRELEEAGIRADIVTGTSAGGVIAAFYAADALDAAEKFARSYRSVRVTFSYMDFSIGKGGLVAGRRFESFLEDHLPVRKFSELKKPLGLVATDLAMMEEVHISSGAIIPAVRATVAVPGFLSPQVVDGMQLVDGGLLNPVPVSLARKLGADIVIAVDLNSTITRREPKSLTGIMGRTIDTMMNRVRLENFSRTPPDCLIEPVLADFGFMDYHRTDEAIEKGRLAAKASLGHIQRTLDSVITRSEKLVINTGKVQKLVQKFLTSG